jgi:uncharacterized protein
MKISLATVDADRFGPWAVVTGASSGIGTEFARQLAANGINVVLVARRLALLQEVGRVLADRYGVEYRAVSLDLTDPNFLARIVESTQNLDVGLLVSNAGAGIPGEFLAHDLDVLRGVVRLNTMAHLDLTHHFGQRLARRGRGGVVLVSATGGLQGMPYMANDAATKAYVFTLGEGLHTEFAKHGLNMSVLLPGPTDTPVLETLGFEPGTSPVKPMPVEQCVTEALAALTANRATHIPGRINRLMATVIPRKVATKMMGRMIGQWVERKAASTTATTTAGQR